jgi:flagellar biosynthesis protein FlhF
MMEVKKYRAATMRDALEQIKSELGEDALVLGSKEVHHKGFLGLGAKDFVEVRVSTEFAEPQAEPPSNRNDATRRKSTFTSLSLRDESQATPATPLANRADAVVSVLTARANSTRSKAFAELKAAAAPILSQRPAANAAGDLNTNPAAPKPTVRNEEKPDGLLNAAAKRDSLSGELDRLRSELREVKFTLTSQSFNIRKADNPTPLADLDEADSAIYDSPFYEAYLHLNSLGIEPQICRAAMRAVIDEGIKTRGVHQLAHAGLSKVLPSFVKFAAKNENATSQNSVIALVGPTGVGKTTTIAKLAARASLRERRRVELITLDTYRIAAVEQLKTYAEIIGAGFHVPRSVLELDALVRRLSSEALVLIDTIGRSARDLADQIELADYLRTNEEIKKYVVIQATTHPSDAALAMSKFALFGANGLVITKLDETGRPGAAISTAALTEMPLVYLCTGQRVPEDIETANAESLAACVLPAKSLAAAAAA